ncbi:pirin family protein [Piscinibacter sp.]|uniref:pirin family protein n=1 Tax=Piscinibacter sp. TaxID=1903157 RepID=UPI0039E7251E
MITLRKSCDRGHADHGWLKSFHSFSFADYVDARHMGWGNLRVINEDRIAPGTGFGTHGHRDMEILSVVLEGELAHRDSIGAHGHGGVVRAGEVQRMSAGRGVRHSEYNHAHDGVTHFLQIWIVPDEAGIEPSYEQKRFDDADRRGRLRPIASRDGRDGSLRLHADATVYAGLFDGAEAAELALAPARLGYVHLVRGELDVNGHALRGGDALLLADEPRVSIAGGREAEVLVFDLAA